MSAHAAQKFVGDRNSNGGAYDRVNAAFWTYGSPTYIDPLNDSRRWKRSHAIEAAADLARLDLTSVIAAESVGRDDIHLFSICQELRPPKIRPWHFLMTFLRPLGFALGYSEAILQALDKGLHFLVPQVKRITMRADRDEADSGKAC
jgi:hypothetical protein